MTYFESIRQYGSGGSVAAVRGNRLGGFYPGGVDHVAQLDGAGGELPFDEGLAVGGSGAGECSGFLHLVGLLDERVGVAEVGQVLVEDIAHDDGFGGFDQGGEVGGLDVGVDEFALKEGVDVVLGGVAVGLGPTQPLYWMEVCRGMEPSAT